MPEVPRPAPPTSPKGNNRGTANESRFQGIEDEMERVAKRSTKQEVMGLMEPLIAEWFSSKFSDLTEPQSYAIPIIHRREHVLVSSPTGSGKTMTAFLSIINELFKCAKAGKLEEKIYAVYVSPLKALANDINRNLEEPLREISELARKERVDMPNIRVGLRTGDTPQAERQRMLKRPPHILITTPESLALALAAPKFRERFASVEYLIVDEIHEICDSKRGVFLSLTLERLQDQVKKQITRIGLSATLAPIEDIAQFLVGHDKGKGRDVNIVEVKTRKNLDLKVLCPVEDMTTLSYEVMNSRMYDLLKGLIDSHTSTIVFTNTRSGTESVVYKLKERGIESIEAHHGSLAKETRLDVEERLKTGQLRCVVSSTSLELGIDIGFVDLVCQIGSPKSVAKGMQRVGRSGHSHGKTAKGRMIVFDMDDLVECAVLCRAAHRSNIDRVTIPENCLDVLAQSIVGMSIEKRWEVDEAFDLVRRSHCYRNLSKQSFLEVLRYLGSREGFEGVYSKIWLDEDEGRFGKKKGARMIYFLNLGTIPEEANYKVVNERGAFVGDLSEKFVERLAPGDVFVLGGRSYEYLKTKGMKAFARSASGRKPTVPSWTGEMLPRSFDLSVEIARFRRELAEHLDEPEDEVIDWLGRDFDIDQGSARSIVSYFKEQRSAVNLIPNDRTLAVEGYLDRRGNHNVIFHFPFGRRVNDALSRAYAFKLTQQLGSNVSVSVLDDAFMISVPRQVSLADMRSLVKSDELEGVLCKAIKDSEMFKQRFRHTASRSFMILRNYKGRQVSVNRQQVRSGYLLDYLSNLEHVPVIDETYREILEDVMDLANARAVLEGIEKGQMDVACIDFSSAPSPFAHSIVLAGISDIVLMEDRSALLKELHRKVLERVMEGDLDRFEFEQEAVVSYFARKRGRISTKDELVTLLKRTGPLHIFKERGRSVYSYSDPDKATVDAWASELLEEGKIASVHIDDLNYVASEDLSTYAPLLAKDRELGETERKALELLADSHSAAEVAETLGVDIDKALRALHVLETMQVVGRASRKEGKWRYRRRDIALTSKQEALDKAIITFLGAFGPASADEVAFVIGQEEAEVASALSALTAEEILDEGRFVISERTQYMLKLDHLRLRAGGQRVYDSRTIDSYRRRKGEGPFQSIEECVRFFGEMGMPVDIHRRVPSFDVGDWERLRTSGRLLLGRFRRARVRYVLDEDAALYVAAYRMAGLGEQDQRILNVIASYQGMSMRQLMSELGLEKEELKESLDRLDRNTYVVRKYDEGEEWARENVYLPFEAKEFDGDALVELVRRFLLAYGPVPLFAMTSYTGFSPDQVKRALSQLEVSTITVSELHTEMYLLAEEAERLESFVPSEEGTKIVSLYDPSVQPMWAEIASRYGDGWVFPILHKGRLVGAAEKWNMSGCVEVRSLDLDDDKLLAPALGAIDRMMTFYKLLGCDVVRLREVLGKDAAEVPPEVDEVLRQGGYVATNGLYVKGRFTAKVFTHDQVFSYVFRKQRVLRSRRFRNILEAVKSTGGLRSEADAFLRSKVKVPLKKLAEQGFLVRGVGIPEFTLYTTSEHMSLYSKAKSVPLDQDMRSLLQIIIESGTISKRRLFDLSPVGERRTKEAMRRLHQGSRTCLDGANRIRAPTESKLTQREAQKEVVHLLFRNFGLFSAENLSRFMKFELRMRDLRSILAELEDEGLLVKGFLMQDDQTMHWALASEIEKIGPLSKEEFVLTPMDNLWYYIQPQVKERFGTWCYVLFRGPEMVGMFRARKKGSDLIMFEMQGEQGLKGSVRKHLREIGLVLKEAEANETPEWEVEEFYELTHPGED